MQDLAAFGSLLTGGPADANGDGERMARSAESAMASAMNEFRQHSASMPSREKPESSGLGREIAEAKATAARLMGEVAEPVGGVGEATPEYTIDEAADCATLKVALPQLAALGETSVDVSDDAFSMHAPGLYKLELDWPRSGVSDEAKAKFNKKSRTLQVTIPLVV